MIQVKATWNELNAIERILLPSLKRPWHLYITCFLAGRLPGYLIQYVYAKKLIFVPSDYFRPFTKELQTPNEAKQVLSNYFLMPEKKNSQKSEEKCNKNNCKFLLQKLHPKYN